MRGRPIRVLTIDGPADHRGMVHGAAFHNEIRQYAADRLARSGAGTSLSRDQLLELAEACLPAHEDYDAELYEEMLYLSRAAGLTPAEAVIVGGYTDFIDLVRAHSRQAGTTEDTCTAVIVPDSAADGAGFLAQTWDMHASATPHIVMLRVEPDQGPPALVFSTVGCLGQIGMNAAGVAVGINNLNAADGRVGVTWPFVVRKALAQTSFQAAVDAIVSAPLAGGHNFLVFDGDGNGASIEAMPTTHHVERLDHEPLVHTNHCLVPATQAVEAPRPADLVESSRRRLDDAGRLLASRPVTVDQLIALTRDEAAICRHPAPPHDYESCGAAIMRPRTGEFWACWGIPSENDYELLTLPLTTGGAT